MSSAATKSSLAALTLGAIGIVYGDIGTSPLYALKVVFDSGLIEFTPKNVYGILSLVFWTITVIVSLKYVTLILRADYNGEGGLIAMLTLASQAVRNKPALRRVLLMVGIFGTAIFYGDGVITPAISVLSAIEGMELFAPHFHPFIIPVAVIVLFGLFFVQKYGTGGIGKFFGPITLLWFFVIAVLGVWQIARHPAVLLAINPYYALHFVFTQPGTTFLLLGALILTVTGGEALYADMGHFGKSPIRLAWFAIVMPALVLNYFGQGALLLEDPAAVHNPFFHMVPPAIQSWALAPLVVLATAATVIASQALLSAAFSVTKQAIQLGYLPRMVIQHTSTKDIGQIYIPAVNWLLFAAVLLAIGLFRNSTTLASAYGIVVSSDMLITTVLTFFVIHYAWRLPLVFSLVTTICFFLIDLSFWASNLLKIIGGGWFPVFIGIGVFLIMTTWKQGRRLLNHKLREEAIELKSFLASIFLSPPQRVDGTAIFMTAQPGVTPHALLHNLKHNKVLHDYNLFVTVYYHETPHIDEAHRLKVEPLGNHCWQVVVNYGFKDEPDLPQALQGVKEHGCALDPMNTSYFLSRDVVTPTFGGGMAAWREKLFAQMHHNASAAADYLNLPNNAVVELGSKVEI